MKIGLEIHVQLPTKSKMFCSCPTTDAPAPNTHVCPTCLGMPGSRPVLNKEVLVCGIKLAKMLGCSIADTTWFSRKTYFYPDMCKSVQITQYDHPIGVGGVIYLNGKKPIRITRIHLEEDPGKTKRTSDMYALVDYNRSGIPLAEIVTEPDLATPAEAREFLGQLIQDIKHTLDLENSERSIRCDCNISVGKERCEIKNVTGLKNVETALTYEMVRQIKVLKAGGKIERATMNFDETRGITYGARKKEFEADYGYIDEPDLGIYHIKELADSITIKEAPAKMILRMADQYKIEQKMAKQLVSTSTDLAQFFETVAKEYGTENAVKWVAGPVTGNWKAFSARDGAKTDDILAVIGKFVKGKITDTECGIEIKSVMTGIDASAAAQSSEGLDKLINDYLDQNPGIVNDYKKSDKAANRVIGYVMKQTGGQYTSAEIVESTKKLIEARL
ncbi:MAG: Asp-tRNA(Asn)/Glu-tRNA(Gln) amidotransferase subunit GatB [archaeon]|nr:Asp-tRNA(Asn)/Glu-tRNA(Gln) amidotransferase subunit GatB [archaeon]